MRRWIIAFAAALGFVIADSPPHRALAADVQLLRRPLDPYGTPRPADRGRDVPVKTSIYFELSTPKDAKGDSLLADSVSISLQAAGGEAFDLVQTGQRFAAGASGWIRPKQL